MKCPHCGKWNQAAFPRCYQCGAELPRIDPDAIPVEPSWQEKLRNAEPSETYIKYEEDSNARELPDQNVHHEILGREIESLKERRERGALQLATLRHQARRAKETIGNAAIIKPAEEIDPYEALLNKEPIEDLDENARVPVRKRQRGETAAERSPAESKRTRRTRGKRPLQPVVLQPIEMPSFSAYSDASADAHAQDWRGQTAAAWKAQSDFIYTDDGNAPVLYDGYLPSPTDKRLGARGMDPDPMIAEREKATWNASQHAAISTTYANGKHQTMAPKSAPIRKPKKRKNQNVMFKQWAAIIVTVGVVVAAIIIGMPHLLSSFITQPIQAEATTPATITVSEIDGQPAHTIWIPGKENTQIYIEELEKAYVVTGGTAEVQIVDYFWYEGKDDITEANASVQLTPLALYSSGEQVPMPPITYTIDIPLSPVRLIRPQSLIADVSTSILDLRLQVERTSRVKVNGEDVSHLIDTNGRVTKNVPVEAIGDNIVHVSVHSPRCRPNNFEIVLRRQPQDVPLEMAADTLSETEGTSDEDLIEDKEERDAAFAALAEAKKTAVKKPQMKLFARTVPDAEIEILSPYKEGSLSKTQLAADGSFSFIATFPKIGENEVLIKATFDGRSSILPHVVTYVPPEDIYSKKAWSFERSDYVDLVNNITLRVGQVYVCKGIIKEFITEERPQLAIMDTDPTESEQLVLLENSSKTNWTVGGYFRVYGEAFSLYDTMPRITVRYTYTN